MGKGSSWRKGTNYKKYNDAEIWDIFAKRREENELCELYDKCVTEELSKVIKEKGITDIGICGIDKNSIKGRLQILATLSDV